MPLLLATSFSSGPQISPSSNVSTEDSLSCTFTPEGTGSLMANITWFLKNTSTWENYGGSNVTNQAVSASTHYDLAPINFANTLKHQTWMCQVTVFNSTSSNISNSSEISIQNSAPFLTNPIITQIVTEDVPFNLQATASDPDPGDSIVDWISSDSNYSYYGSNLFEINRLTGEINFTVFNESLAGDHYMDIIIKDGDTINNIGGNTIIFRVVPVNDTPEFTSPVSAFSNSCTEGSSCEGSFTTYDEEDDVITFLSNDSSINLNSSTGVYSFIPLFNHIGTNIINITIDDGVSNASRILTIDVVSANVQPVKTFENNTQTLQTNISNFIYALNVSDANDGDTVNFTLQPLDCNLSVWNLSLVHNASGNVNASMIITPLSGFSSNKFVQCRNISIKIDDYNALGNFKSSYIYNVTLNITNENDAPEIFRYSYYSENYAQNDAENLSDSTGFIFNYLPNSTDVDLLTYENESFTFSLNDTSVFSVNSSSGKISSDDVLTVWDPSSNLLLLTMIDDEGLNDTQIINISIVVNDPPEIYGLNTSDCFEESFCSKYLIANDTEAEHLSLHETILTYTDPLGNVTVFDDSETRAILNITFDSYSNADVTTTYLLNFSTDDKEVGSYSLNFTYMDVVTATSSEVLNFDVVQINDTPFLVNESNQSVSGLIYFPDTITETFYFEQTICAFDGDLYYGLDSLTFNDSMTTGSLLAPISFIKINSSCANISFTPQVGDANSVPYVLNISVVDANNFSDYQEVAFKIYNVSEVPEIISIQPHYNTIINDTVNSLSSVFLNASGVSHVNGSENSVITFDLRASDLDNNSLFVDWYFDGSENDSFSYSDSGASSKSFSFDFFSSGIHNISAKVYDKGYVWYSWILNVSDANRPPVQINNLSDMLFQDGQAISGTTIFVDFFRQTSQNNIVFLDPDDDINGNNYLDELNESNTLSFQLANTTCSSFATFTFSGPQLTIVPLAVGRCNASFIASDSEYNLTSNTIIIDVTALDGESSSSSSSSSGSSGGGGGGGYQTRTVPILLDDEVPLPNTLKLVTAKSPIALKDSLIIPLTLRNTYDRDLSDVTLSATFSLGNLTHYFTIPVLDLALNQTTNINLTILNVSQSGSFEAIISAHVLSLDYTDITTVFIDSTGTFASGSVESQLAFAHDLLVSNPSCAELNEFLLDVETDDLSDASASERIQSVISACKYLMSEEKSPSLNVPGSFASKLDFFLKPVTDYRLLGGLLAVLFSIALGVALLTKRRFKNL